MGGVPREALKEGLSIVGRATGHRSGAVTHLSTESEIVQPVDDDHTFSTLTRNRPAVSVIIPLHNEEFVVAGIVAKLLDELNEFNIEIEFLLCENGSKDQTRGIASKLASEHASIRLVLNDHRSYGEALRSGIREARGVLLIIFNADLFSKRFFKDSITLLANGYDIVVGSKRFCRGLDHRPWLRRAITASFNIFLKFAFGFSGTDTHGMKALRRSRILDICSTCQTFNEVFDTELILRAQHAGLKICELPVEVRDIRPPRLSLLARIPSTVRDLWTIGRNLKRPHQTEIRKSR